VEDLEDEVAGLSTFWQIEKWTRSYRRSYQRKKRCNWRAQRGYQKYTKQQETVRNNREFNSLTKVEFQKLEIQLAEKQMKEMKASIDTRKTSFLNQRKIRSEIKSLET
jgi:hypothetical protein